MIVLCAAVVCGAAIGFSRLQTPQYTATSSLLFNTTNFSQELFNTTFVAPSYNPTEAQTTNLALVELPVVARRTAAVLGISPGVVVSAVSVSEGSESDVAQISATDRSPRLSARIANAYAEQYVLFRQEAERSQIAAGQELVNQKLAALSPQQRSGSVGQALQNRANELSIMASLQTGDAQVVQRATVPKAPSSPKTKRNAAIGLLLGLLLGLVVAIMLQRFDRRIRETSGLESAYGATLLATVPHTKRLASAHPSMALGAEQEVFSLLRARLRYFNVDRDLRSILITSSTPGEGKTTVALNLAVAEAAARTGSVVLVEADLRRPVLAKRLGIKSYPGLSEVLSRNADLPGSLQRVPIHEPGHENGTAKSFSVLTAGATPPNPAQLLESGAMEDLLSMLAETFDHIIIDTPPTSVVSDAIPLIQRVSGVVLVGRIGMTTRDAANELSRQLVNMGAPTIGVVANDLSTGGRSGYYHYSYHSDSAGEHLAEPGANGHAAAASNSQEHEAAPEKV